MMPMLLPGEEYPLTIHHPQDEWPILEFSKMVHIGAVYEGLFNTYGVSLFMGGSAYKGGHYQRYENVVKYTLNRPTEWAKG